MDKHRRFSGSTASRVTKYQQQQPPEKTAHKRNFGDHFRKHMGVVCEWSIGIENRIYLEMWFDGYS